MLTIADVAEAQRSLVEVSPLAESAGSICTAEIVGRSQNFRMLWEI